MTKTTYYLEKMGAKLEVDIYNDDYTDTMVLFPDGTQFFYSSEGMTIDKHLNNVFRQIARTLNAYDTKRTLQQGT